MAVSSPLSIAEQAMKIRAQRAAPTKGAVRSALSKSKPRPKTKAPAPPAAAARRSVNTGPYADALNEVDIQSQQVRDIAGRRLRDNQAYTAWQEQQRAKLAATQVQNNAAADARLAGVQGAVTAAQRQTQETLDRQRGERQGSVTSGPGNSRAALAGDDTLIQSLLGGAAERTSRAAQAEQGKQGFLQAATAAAAAAAAATIRGEASQDENKLRTTRSDLLVRRDDTLAQERAAQAAAIADIEEAQIRAQADAAALSARLQIADESNSTRRELAALSREAAATQGRANRRTRLKVSRESAAARKSAAGKGGVSPSETRQRETAARELRDQVAAATATVRRAREAAKSAGKVLSGPTIRAQLRALYPEISETAVNAAMSAVYDKRAKNGRPYGKAASDLRREIAAIRNGR